MPQRKQRALVVVPREVVPQPGRRCGWPDSDCKLPVSAHTVTPGHRELWTGHTVQCQIPNPDPGPHLDGYPTCCMASEHAAACCYRRHIVDNSPNDHRHNLTLNTDTRTVNGMGGDIS